MIAANVIRLPSAAGEKVIQERKAGRTPKAVPRISDFILVGYKLRMQRELIAKEIDSLRGVIEFSEHSIALARWRMAKLKALEIGSPLADLAALRLEWERTPSADRARQYGDREPIDPLR